MLGARAGQNENMEALLPAQLGAFGDMPAYVMSSTCVCESPRTMWDEGELCLKRSFPLASNMLPAGKELPAPPSRNLHFEGIFWRARRDSNS